MSIILRRISAACTAVAILALATSIATANRLSINRNTDIEIIWTGFGLIPPIGDSIVCRVTLLGHFHSLTITKTPGSLIGFIDHARVGSCTGGAMTILAATLPWHIVYREFRGRLPAMTQGILNLVNAAFEINNDTTVCLAATTTAEPEVGTININESGTATSLQASGSIDLTGSELCDFLGANGQFEGTASVTHLEGDPVIFRLV